MITHHTENELRLPTMRIALISLAACAAVAVIGGLLGGSMNDGLLTLMATVPGVLIPIAMLSLMPARAAGAWGVPVLGGTVIRALVVLTIGLAVFVLLGPARYAFFLTLLAALMIALIVDVASLLMLISKHPRAMIVAGESEGLC